MRTVWVEVIQSKLGDTVLGSWPRKALAEIQRRAHAQGDTTDAKKVNGIALDVIIDAVNDQNDNVRIWAALALGNILELGGTTRTLYTRTVKSLISALKDKNREVRKRAARSLEDIATQAIPKVTEAMRAIDHAIQGLEDAVQKTELIIDGKEKALAISTELLRDLTEYLDYYEDTLNSLYKMLSTHKEEADILKNSYETLSEEMFTVETDALGTLEIEKKQTQLRDMELRLINTSQKIAFMRKTITSLCKP